jgi:hypothetical protein
MIPHDPHCRPFDQLPMFNIPLPSPPVMASAPWNLSFWLPRLHITSDLPNEPLLFRAVRVPDSRLANPALASWNRKNSVVQWLDQETVLLRGSEIEPDWITTKYSSGSVWWFLR